MSTKFRWLVKSARTVVSSELQQHLAKTALNDLSDFASNGFTASEGNHIDVGAANDVLANGLPADDEAGCCAGDVVLLQHF